MSSHDVIAMLERGLDRVKQYESLPLRTQAKYVIPITEIHEVATRRVSREKYEKNPDPTTYNEGEEHEFAFLDELAHWFKESYFSWVNSPDCESCGAPTQHRITKRRLYSERKLPYSARGDGPYYVDCEEHECTSRACKRTTYFFRHYDAAILLNTRRGRCSEWAQVFTLMCRSLGYRVRLVLDVTDHVWTEVYSFSRRKWVHVDSCEAAVDKPLLYERGWGKKLSYVVAVGVDDIQDVSWRYSDDHSGMKSRRDNLIDTKLLVVIAAKRKEMLFSKSPAVQKVLLNGVISELAELWNQPTFVGEYGGRTSGDRSWIVSRGEAGGIKNGHILNKAIVRLADYTVRIGNVRFTYSAYEDAYFISSATSDTVRRGWFSLLYKFSNIQRVQETDWEMVYLARRSALRVGLMEWRINPDPLEITHLEINFGAYVKDGCAVEWLIEDQDRKALGTFVNVDRIQLQLLVPASFLYIRVKLSSGPNSPEIAWQHTQLFRSPLKPAPPDKNNLGFIFTLAENKTSSSR